MSFNRSIHEGGLWDPEKNCYIHWRDKDNSIHGNNMVTPVNFMAIAYGLCDDTTRRNHILEEIEGQMQKEKLFFWPLNLYTYQPGEGNDWQFPFPNYENGDIFLSWGAVAVKAYAGYKPDLALKYVKNVMRQHSIDGLAYQRYGRLKQDGLGDDILAGNSLAVVGLYQAIYGLNPMYNRFYLNPHIPGELAGTELNYRFRGQKLKIALDVGRISVSNTRFTIIASSHFGFFASGDTLSYFDGDNDTSALEVRAAIDKLALGIEKWTLSERRWTSNATAKATGSMVYAIKLLTPNTSYKISVNDKVIATAKASIDGTIIFKHTPQKTTDVFRVRMR